jgi:hypothetical protein
MTAADLRATVAILLCAQALAVLRSKQRPGLADLAEAARLLEGLDHPALRTVEKLDVKAMIG